jgi:hypothetical protein
MKKNLGLGFYVNKNKNKLILSEVVDTPESAKEFIKLNKIKQKQIRAIVIVWDE